MTLNLPRSLLRESEALDAERESNDFLSGLQKNIESTFQQLAPQPAPAPAPPAPVMRQPFPLIEIEQPVAGPTPQAAPEPFPLLSADMFGPAAEPEAPAPAMGARPITGSESVPSNGVQPVQRGPVARGTPVSPDEPVTKETVGRAAATALERAGLPVEMAPYIAGIAINEGILQPGTIARDHWSVGGVKAPGSAGVVTVPTREVINGQSVMQTASFGKFNSMQEGMDELAKFVRDSPRFGPVAQEAAKTGDYAGMIEGFRQKGYATDPNWTRQVNSIASTVPAVAPQTTAMPQTGETTSAAFAGGAALRGSQFGDPELSSAEANAACGPAAAIAFAKRMGRNPTLREATDLAATVGWNAGQGMAGPSSQVKLLEKMGVAASMSAPDEQKMAADVQRGNPVTIDTPGHYFVAEAYDPKTGKFNWGTSATDLKAAAGNAWYRLDELAKLGMGAARTAIHLDNPDTPQPSIVAGRSKQSLEVERAPELAQAVDTAVGAQPSRIKGMDPQAALAMSGTLAYQTEDAEPPARDDWRMTEQAGAGDVASAPAPPPRDIRGDYAPGAVEPEGPAIPYGVAGNVEPGDFALPTASTPLARPDDAVEPVPTASPVEAPASSGNPIVDLFTDFGRKLSGVLQPANTAAVGALNAGADAIGSVIAPPKPDYAQVAGDIRGRGQAVAAPGELSIADVAQGVSDVYNRGAEDGSLSPSQQIFRPVVSAAQGFSDASIRDADRLAELSRHDRMFGGPGLTPEEEAEYARLFINQYADIGGVSAIRKLPGVVGQAAQPILEEAARKGVPEAADALAELASRAAGVRAPSAGIVSRAQADEAGRTMGAGGDAITSVPVDPDTLRFREVDQGNLEGVRQFYPDQESYVPITTVVDDKGQRSILDGHNRAAVARERGHSIPVVDVTSTEYQALKTAGYDDMAISYAALIRAGEEDAAMSLNLQFPGAKILDRGEDALDVLSKLDHPPNASGMLPSGAQADDAGRVIRPAWADDLESVGGSIDNDGTVLLYHATTREQADQILKEGVLRRPKDASDAYGVYLGSSPSVAKSYGDGTVVPVRVRASDVQIDDLLSDRADFLAETRGGVFRPVAVGHAAFRSQPPGGLVPGGAGDTTGRPSDVGAAVTRSVGAGAGSAYEESQREGSTPESVLRAGLGGAATGLVNAGARRLLGRRAVEGVARAVQDGGGGDAKRTTAFSPTDPNITYELEHRVVDLGQLVTSHGDDFKPNPRFPSDLQPRLRDRAAAAQQVQRIANELNPDALLTDTRSIQTGSPIVGPDNIVESGNGRVMALRQALKRNPEAAARYREEIAKVAADYGIDPAELKGKRFPVLVRERLSDVDRKAFAREANESGTAVLSGFERSLGDAEILTDDLISGLTVAENQSIDQALSAPMNRGIVRAFTQSLPLTEAGTMMDAMGNLSEEGVRRVKQALIVKAYGNSVTGQRMARSMIESIDPGVKNVETAIYGSLPSVARLESVSMRGDLSISGDIAKAADMYARLKQNSIRVSDYMNQGSLWERETTPAQDALIRAFEENKRSPRRIREILEGYVERAEPQANPSQGDLFGGAVARASKEDLLDSAIQDFGRASEEAESAATSSVREGLDGGAARRVPEYRDSGYTATATLDEGSGPPVGTVRIGSDSLQPELPGTEPSRGLYVGAARKRTQQRLDDAMAKGEAITLTDEQEMARLRTDKFPEEMRPWMVEAAQNADWFRTQRRGVVPDVAVQEASSKMWASIDDVIKRGNAGKAYNPEETVAIRNLLRGQYEVVQDYAQRLLDPELRAKDKPRLVAEQLAEAQKLNGLFEVAEGARAEAGRTLRQYREFARSLKDNPEEAGLRYIKARFGGLTGSGGEGAEKAVATYTQMVQDGASPQELAGFLRNVKPAWMDRLNIIRYGSMLSSTTTHLRNITGNVLNIGQNLALRPVAAGIDAARSGITGGERTRYMGESSEMVRGMLEGVPTGIRDLATTLKTGVNPNEIQTIDNLRGGFGSGSGKVDALVEGPLRALSGADAFFRAVTMGGHSRAVAFRKASQEGLTGTARMERVQDIVENLHRNLDVLDEAGKQSARDILQEDRLATRSVMQIREGVNGVVPYLGDVVLPFVRTPMNIAAQGIEMSPLGFASVVKDARAGRVGDATDTAARAMFGTALMYGAGTLAMNNMLTGGYPEDARTRSTLPPGWQPYSLKLGDKYIQYSNLGPFGIPIAMAAILAEAKKSGKPIDPGAVVMSMGKYMGDQTFMRGLSDVVKAINEPGRYGEGVLENIGTQLVPFAAMGRQIERAMGMAQKDPHGAWEAIQASYPFSAGNVADRLDSRGRPIMPSQTGIETFISPTNISTEKPDQVLSVLRKNGIGIGAPPKSLITPGGGSVELTAKQKQQFQQLLYSEIQQNLIDFNDPSEAERAMGRARARARESLLMAVR